MFSKDEQKCTRFLLFGLCIGVIIIQCMKKSENALWYDEHDKIDYKGVTISPNGVIIGVVDKWLASTVENSKRNEDKLTARLTRFGLETTGNIEEKHCRFKKALDNCNNKSRLECSNYGC